jgi:hypothetical protein
VDEPLTVKDRQKRKEKSLEKLQRELMITTSDGSQCGFLLLRRWHRTGFHCPPLVFGGALVKKESLDWRRFEGKRFGER